MRRRGRSPSPGASLSPPASCLTIPGWYRAGPLFHNDTKTAATLSLGPRLILLHVLLDLPVLPVLAEDRERPVDLQGVSHDPDAPPEGHPVEPQRVGAGDEVENDQEDVDADVRREVDVEAAQLVDA